LNEKNRAKGEKWKKMNNLTTVYKFCLIFYLVAALLSLYIAFNLSFGLKEVLLLIATFFFIWKAVGYRAKKLIAKNAKDYAIWSCVLAIIYLCQAAFLGYQYFSQRIASQYSVVASVLAGISAGLLCIEINFWKRKIDAP
jgi:uncharacterized membrane protein